MMTHAEALHWVMCPDQNMVATALPLCRQFILGLVPCVTERRVHDLVLHLFIDASDEDWHLEVNGQPSEKRLLFSEYLAAGFIKINEPVDQSTVRTLLGSTRDPSLEMYPLEWAIRKSSVATVTALLDEGADESRVVIKKIPGLPQDILRAVWLLSDDPDVEPMMVAAVTQALMRRRIGAQNSSSSGADAGRVLPRRRMVI